MQIIDVISRDFLVARAGDRCAELIAQIRELRPERIVAAGKAGFYLLDPERAVGLLADGGESVVELDAWMGEAGEALSPVMDPYLSAALAPDRCVVVRADRILGFFDAAIAPPHETRGLPESGAGDLRNAGSGEIGDGFLGNPWKKSDASPAAESLPESRFLIADLPETLRLGATASLLVSLVSKATRALALGISAPLGEPVDIVLRATGGVRIIGSAEAALVAGAPDDEAPHLFKVEGTQPGSAEISVLAFLRGQFVGKLQLGLLIVAESPEASNRLRVEAPLINAVRSPDLTLLVLENPGPNGRPELSFRLVAQDPELRLHYKRFGPYGLRSEPARYARALFQEIERCMADRADLSIRLEAMGIGLFKELFPEELRTLLWSLRDRIHTVQIVSSEAWIPWEFCKLQGREEGRVVDGPFFCEKFALTRALDEHGCWPEISLAEIALVAPGLTGLSHASAETAYLLSLAQQGSRVEDVPAETADLLAAMEAERFTALHFTGHGVAAESNFDRSIIELDNKRPFTADLLWHGKARGLATTHALVFLNACQTAQAGPALVSVAGWASRFLEAGAGVFVGSYWSPRDLPAYCFARAFYENLLAGQPLGEATRNARLAIKQEGDPTWLAYTVYGDPWARLKPGA